MKLFTPSGKNLLKHISYVLKKRDKIIYSENYQENINIKEEEFKNFIISITRRSFLG